MGSSCMDTMITRIQSFTRGVHASSDIAERWQLRLVQSTRQHFDVVACSLESPCIRKPSVKMQIDFTAFSVASAAAAAAAASSSCCLDESCLLLLHLTGSGGHV